jgi:very-short-patch-repair endonuclease
VPVFRGQHPIGPYVLDFYCAKARLAVDGMSHDSADRLERDARNDAWLRERGIAVMRIPGRRDRSADDGVGQGRDPLHRFTWEDNDGR